MRVKALCESLNLHFAPHRGVSGIGLAATLHLLCTHGGWTWAEFVYDPPYRTVETCLCLGGVLTTPIRIDAEGFLSWPPGAGLGVAIDPDMIGQQGVKAQRTGHAPPEACGAAPIRTASSAAPPAGAPPR